MAERSPLGYDMCTKCRKIDFFGAFFVKRVQAVDMNIFYHDNELDCDVAYILNTHKECRCCSLIFSGIRRFYPALLEKTGTKVSWHHDISATATVKTQNGEVEYRSVVHIGFFGQNIRSGDDLVINLLPPSGELDVGLRARRVNRSQAELPLIADWIAACKEGHKDCQHKFWQRSIDELRLRVIDVQERCIVAASKDCEYIALSYVWGQVPMVVTRKENIEAFSHPQGLDIETLPRTITDAMELVRAVGHRYLWVDALCIIQDDKDDKLHQIHNMNLVYGLAHFTVVVADGEGAYAELVGVKPESRNIVQDIEEVEPGLTLAVSLGGFGPRRRALSKWNSRAWTFQEALLSPRMVIFCGGEMTWECREAVWTEDLHVSLGVTGSFTEPHFNSLTPLLEGRLEAMNANSSVLASPFAAMRLHNLTAYEKAVNDYTSREMTYQSDGLHAFAGLANTFEMTLATGFVQGLPQNHLDTAMLWTPEQALHRRSGFASWSWVGWIGKSRYLSMNPNVIKPMVRYYMIENKTGGDHAPGPCLHQEWEEENYKPALRPWRVVKSILPSSPSPWRMEKSISPSSHSLCVYALTASSEHFSLEMLKAPLPLLLKLCDQADSIVGRMGLDGGVYPGVGRYSLIVLSESSHPVQREGLGLEGLGWDLPSMITPSARSGEGDEGELPMFNVMLVGWTAGVAERVGLGWMWKTDFLRTKPEWTWVVLR